MSLKSIFRLLLLVPLCFYALSTAHAANEGEVVYLTPSGENPVNIATELRVTSGKINNSNLRFFIYDEDDNLVHTHGPVSVPTLEIGNVLTFAYDWDWNTPGLGEHSVEICWSPGNSSSNCKIGQSNTDFTSVSTLGTSLTIIAALLVIGWFFYVARLERQAKPA